MPPPAPLPEGSRLVLVGTVHLDDRGFARAVGFLNSFQPELIFVELSPYGKTFRDRHQARLQRTLNRNLRVAAGECRLPFREALTHPEVKAVRRQLGLPFEYRAARRFCRATEARLFLVDHSPFSRQMIALWPDLLASENLVSLLSLPRKGRPEVARIYDLAAQRIRGKDQSPAGRPTSALDSTDRDWEMRERHLANTIRSLLHRHRPLKAAYLGGWLHLSIGGNFPSLRELLTIGLSRCALLDRPSLQPLTNDH